MNTAYFIFVTMIIYPIAVNNALLKIEQAIESLDISSTKLYDDNILHLEIKHFHLTFWFLIKKYDVSTKTLRFIIQYNPADDLSFLQTKEIPVDQERVLTHLKIWSQRVKHYQTMTTPFQDKYEKIYEEQFEEYFQLVDEDADIEPFDIVRQDKLNNLLNNVIGYLEANITEENQEEYNNIISESKQLKAELTTTVKSTVVKKLSKIAAKLWRLGIDVAKGAMGSALWDVAQYLIG